MILLWLVAGPARAQTFTNLLCFSGTSGAYLGEGPACDLTLSGTTLYGLTLAGGSSGAGNVFSVGTDGSGFQNLYSFSDIGGYAAIPYGTLVLSGTTLYGTTLQGNSNYTGTIFSIGTNGSGFHNLLTFSGTRGCISW